VVSLNKTVTELEQSILIKVNHRKMVAAQALMSELTMENIGWNPHHLRQVLIDLANNRHILEVEFLYPDASNESVFVPKNTVIGYRK